MKRIHKLSQVPFNGSIDNVKIYSRALTANEVKAEYLASANNYTIGLGAGEYYWELTSGEGQNYTLSSIILPLNISKAITHVTHSFPSCVHMKP